MPNPFGANPAAAGQDRLRQAFDLQRQGRLAEAEKIYLQLLKLQPRNAQALHFLGVLMLEQRQAARGVELIGQALAIQPGYAQAHGSLARGLEALGRPQDAMASYERLLALMPGQPDALRNRGRILAALERNEEALADFDRAMALRPSAPLAVDRGVVLMALQRLPEAVAALDRAIALSPNYGVAHFNRALALMRQQMPEAALAGYDKAIACQPDYTEAFVNRGMALEALERNDEALASYDHALTLAPGLEQAMLNRGTLLDRLGRRAEALACYDDAIARAPAYGMFYNNRSNTLRALGRNQEALADLDKAVALMPDFAQSHSNRGVTLVELGRAAEALESYDRAIALAPSYADAQLNKGLALLLSGRLSEGWDFYEARNRLAGRGRVYPQPLWLGEEDIAGKTLFIHWEQGLGDTIQFCRYGALAAARGARVILSVQNQLVRLLANLAPGVEVVGAQIVPGHFDYHTPLLSMPLALRTNAGTIPARVPYLAAEPERLRLWQQRIGADGSKIGICWQGNRQGSIDLGRSAPLACFRDIAAMAGVRLISLQKTDDDGQLAGLAPGMRVQTLGADFDAGPDAFLDTAAAMMACDLIITTDTSIPHLAGALGRPVWMALRLASEWRWQQGRQDSPWYPTMTLFRQPAAGDWDSVFAAMAQKLAGIARG